jgi:DNA polymerase III subunit delta'
MATTMIGTAWQEVAYQKYIGSYLAGTLGHAQLLYGQALLGKHALAESVAKRLLCSGAGQNLPACGTCISCQRFALGTHGDFKSITREINEKTGKLFTVISVDQIRAFNEWLSLTSQLGTAQVAIINNAHDLNPNAANALLKTLEEPLQNRYIFLVTDKPQRLPATIHSRCQRTEMPMPTAAQALQWMLDLGIATDKAHKALVLSDGNPGKAQHMLENGDVALFEQVREELLAVMKSQMGASELSKKWLADEKIELKLEFTAQIAHNMAKKWALSGDSWLKTNKSLQSLQEWIDAVNRLRLSLNQPLRHDLSLAGLFYDWRLMLQDSR